MRFGFLNPSAKIGSNGKLLLYTDLTRYYHDGLLAILGHVSIYFLLKMWMELQGSQPLGFGLAQNNGTREEERK